MKEYILVSACLTGKNTKYNGGNNYISKIEALKEKYELILICPEVDGGLSTPRNPSEIINGKVFMNNGTDVTLEYYTGANIALGLAKKYNCTKALLKEKSPSCGTHKIYNGKFEGTLIDGMGITAKLLAENNILVYSENQIDELL